MSGLARGKAARTMASKVVVWADKSFTRPAKSKHAEEIMGAARDIGARCELLKCKTTQEAVAAARGNAGRLAAVVSNMRRSESQTAGLDLYNAVGDIAPVYYLFTTTDTPAPAGGGCPFRTVKHAQELTAEVLKIV